MLDVHTGAWILIDCYDFCEATDHERRVNTKRLRSAGTVAEGTEWRAADDLAQVVTLAEAVQFQGEAYDMFATLRALAASVAADEATVDDVIDLVEEIVV